ncbi:MAG: phosphoglycerate dehydrogenase [archaeon]|nr:phosphoglycerate dehydrogenase [archaeon]
MSDDIKKKVIIAEAMAEDGINLIRYNKNFEVVVLKKSEKDKLLKEITNAHAIIVRSGVKITEELLKVANNLKIVGRAGAGYDNIDVKACSQKGIAVMIAPAGNTNGVVEITIGLLFALIRHIPKADQTMKNGIWAKKNLKGSELKDKTIGLVGLGKIGSRVAEICNSLGMNVIALVNDKTKKRNLSFHPNFVDSLEELLPNVDFLSLHVPLNQKTRNLIGKKELDQMKPSAYIINTARGAVIDEKALYNMLKEEKIAGAAIDVYSEEPAPKEKFPFVELENVIVTPHLGASTKESQSNVSRIICENIIEALEHNIFIDAVNLPFSISAEQSNEYRPHIILAKRLGQLIGQYIYTPITDITIKFRNNIAERKPILMTLYTEIFKEKNKGVSLVNIEDFLKDNKIKLISENDNDLTHDNSIKVDITCEDGYIFSIRGLFIAGVPKIEEIQNIHLEVVLAGRMLIIRNLNVPGVIGKLGSLLGFRKINIAEMHLGRSEAGGETKGAIIIDNEVPLEVINELKNIKNVIDVKQIYFE